MRGRTKNNYGKFGKPMKAVIFARSNHSKRGLRLATHKAGLFCFPAKGFRIPISGGLPLPSAKKHTTRASGWFDGGIRQAAFLSAYVNKSHHAHRNQASDRPAARQNPAGYSGTIPATRPRNAAATLRNSPGFFAQKNGAFGAGETPIIRYYSVH